MGNGKFRVLVEALLTLIDHKKLLNSILSDSVPDCVSDFGVECVGRMGIFQHLGGVSAWLVFLTKCIYVTEIYKLQWSKPI